MRIVFTLSVLVLICTSSNVHAQLTGKINGQVKNAAGGPVTAATIILYHIPDSAVVKTGITNAQGKFE